MSLPSAPDYDRSLAQVLPEVLTSLEDGTARRAVVVLIDGLGDRQLRARSGHAPFLRGLLAEGRTLDCGYPSTTVTSTATFGTGRPPGEHGLVGYRMRDPGTGEVVEGLSWADHPDPLAWQPHETVFEQALRRGLGVTTVSQGRIAGSGLTRAGLRGGRFVVADRPGDRVEATLDALRALDRGLVYLYWPEVDKAGHVHGPASWQWGESVEEVDAALGELARRLPRGTSLTVTADHGMIDLDPDTTRDLATDAVLDAGVTLVTGEVRAPQLTCAPGAAAAVAGRWRDVLGDDATVLLRDEAIAAGWFGPVEERVLARIGEVVVAMRERAGVVDSRVMRPRYLGLRGHHGGLTADEVQVPLLHLPAA